MNDTERSGLRQVLVGYFGDNSTEDGVREMLGVTRARADQHEEYRGLLATALDAARAGDEDVLPVVRQLAPFTPDLTAAAALLAAILTEYDRQYAQS
ncbi:hypothetical protein [Paractinoplanes durhamensis]|uniref:CdiI immunity protein domain-containing protein n=1 Tax=Paractinoplanes durhamensis TaxID=113563 RepID=A0ABQ3YU26_9ACTN|nr:hypothetical protein [Actinoplanes durhamensis]GIE01056.1 hypothetical protein Adu01nite_24060 [Actinoplanes durhamensis]